MIPIPDLLYDQPSAEFDSRLLSELLELAFLGRHESRRIHKALGEAPLQDTTWEGEFFQTDLFLKEFVSLSSAIAIGGKRFPLHEKFLFRVLTRPPATFAE